MRTQKNRHEKVTKTISTVLAKLGEKQIVVASNT